jgi:YVTN family beta-propeller protein
MKNYISKSLTLLIISFTFFSCSKESVNINNNNQFSSGYFVTNEGNFGSGNGSLSYVDENNQVTNNVFSSINSFPLGDVVQSMSIINDNAYIVVNGSAKIEVATIDSLQYVTTINGFSGPRNILQVDVNKAYVSDWFSNTVQVIDLETNEITSAINCGQGPEALCVNDNLVYVCNIGGYSVDSTISIIDVYSDMLVSTLTVGDKPSGVVVDINNDIWVLCSGATYYDANWNVESETQGKLVKISNGEIVSSFSFELGNHPKGLMINESKDVLYFNNGNFSTSIYSFNISNTTLPTNPIINRSFYKTALDNNYIYGTDAVDYVQNGWSYKYNLQGNLLDSVQVSVIPGNYCFN